MSHGPLSFLLILSTLLVSRAGAEELSQEEGYGLIRQVLSEDRKERREAARRLTEAGDASLVPGLVDALFFIPRPNRGEAQKVLEALTGARPGVSYYDWVEFVGAHSELEPKEGYLEWKRELLARIDPNYKKVFYPGAPSQIRLEEIVWGGVRLDGIPSIDHPRHIPAGEAGYLRDKERVFGVSLGGQHRAYPLRILSWHEMLNDEVGGEPVTLSYCTLCGSGILYSARTTSGGRYSFGTSGLLYRSNKLMFDRQSYSLWSNLSGRPVFGRKARTSAELKILPMTLTTWGEWSSRHSDTTVLELDREMARRFNFDYRPGAADRRRAGVSFPIWLKSDALDAREEIYALTVGGRAKAYPLDSVLEERVINDELGKENLVLVGDNGGGVRAYRRGDHTFRPGKAADELIDEEGREWRLLEDRLTLRQGDKSLERLPGHVAFWAGWYGFHPDTEIYGS